MLNPKWRITSPPQTTLFGSSENTALPDGFPGRGGGYGNTG